MLQGKIDATLVSPDNLYEAEQKGLEDIDPIGFERLGHIHQRQRSVGEARFFEEPAPAGARFHDGVLRGDLRWGRANKNIALASFRKHMRENDPRRLDNLYKNYVVDFLPTKPFPMEDVIQAEIENLNADAAGVSRQESRRLRR